MARRGHRLARKIAHGDRRAAYALWGGGRDFALRRVEYDWHAYADDVRTSMAEALGDTIETLVARPRAFERAGNFDTSFPQGEDTEWYARARDVGLKMEMIDEVLVHKRLHGNSTTYSAARAQQWRVAVLRVVKQTLERRRTLE